MALNLDRPAAAAGLGRLGVPQHQGDILPALAVIGIIVVLIPPMPRLPLDDLLAVSITPHPAPGPPPEQPGGLGR